MAEVLPWNALANFCSEARSAASARLRSVMSVRTTAIPCAVGEAASRNQPGAMAPGVSSATMARSSIAFR